MLVTVYFSAWLAPTAINTWYGLGASSRAELVPTPDNGLVAPTLPALDAISSPSLVPADCGVNFTLNVQLAPAESDVAQVLSTIW